MAGLLGYGTIAAEVLVLLGLIFTARRGIRGPTFADRGVCLDLASIQGLLLTALEAVRRNDRWLVDILVLLAVVNFLILLAVAVFLGRPAVRATKGAEDAD